MIAICHSKGCLWRTIDMPMELGMQAHHIATAHTVVAHPSDYLLITGHDSVPALSLLAEIQLAYYTDYSEGCLL